MSLFMTLLIAFMTLLIAFLIALIATYQAGYKDKPTKPFYSLKKHSFSNNCSTVSRLRTT